MNQNSSLPLLLRKLRLPTMSAHWQSLLTKAEQQRWSPDHYLSALCELELSERSNRRIEKLTKESHLPIGKTLPTFDFKRTANLSAKKIEGLCDHIDWVQRAENVLFFGSSGVGKTHLAASVGYGLIQQGIGVRYFAATTIMQELQRARRDVQLDNFLNKLDKYPVIIIDDIGYVKKNEFETHALFELIAHRYESRSMIITSNQPFGKWDQIFAESVMTVATIDRLVHHAAIIEIDAESYRKNQALHRNGRESDTTTIITNPATTR